MMKLKLKGVWLVGVMLWRGNYGSLYGGVLFGWWCATGGGGDYARRCIEEEVW